jgi:putative transposase
VAQRFAAAIRCETKSGFQPLRSDRWPHHTEAIPVTALTSSPLLHFKSRAFFRPTGWPIYFVEVLLGYRVQEEYLLHEFVLMPNHFHLLITPTLILERALQHIKGGFSFRAKRELGFTGEIWRRASMTGE